MKADTSKNKPKKLTPKQSLFVKEYLVDLNATQAALRAGYGEKNAKQQGTENLAKPIIQEAIQKQIKKREEKTELNAEWVLKKLEKIALRCMQEEEVITKDGPTGEFKFDSSGANKAIELIGKHLKMFTDKVEQDTTLTVVRKSFTVDSSKNAK